MNDVVICKAYNDLKSTYPDRSDTLLPANNTDSEGYGIFGTNLCSING